MDEHLSGSQLILSPHRKSVLKSESEEPRKETQSSTKFCQLRISEQATFQSPTIVAWSSLVPYDKTHKLAGGFL